MSFMFRGPACFNGLPADQRTLNSLTMFKQVERIFIQQLDFVCLDDFHYFLCIFNFLDELAFFFITMHHFLA